MCWAASQAGSTCSAFSSAEAAIAACQNEWVSGAALPWRKLSQVELRADAWHTEPRSPRQTCIDEVDFDIDAQPKEDPQQGQ